MEWKGRRKRLWDGHVRDWSVLDGDGVCILDWLEEYCAFGGGIRHMYALGIEDCWR